MKIDLWDLLIYLSVFILLSYYGGVECHNIEQSASRFGLNLGLNYYIYQSLSAFGFMISTVIFLKIYKIGTEQLTT